MKNKIKDAYAGYLENVAAQLTHDSTYFWSFVDKKNRITYIPGNRMMILLVL